MTPYLSKWNGYQDMSSNAPDFWRNHSLTQGMFHFIGIYYEIRTVDATGSSELAPKRHFLQFHWFALGGHALTPIFPSAHFFTKTSNQSVPINSIESCPYETTMPLTRAVYIEPDEEAIMEYDEYQEEASVIETAANELLALSGKTHMPSMTHVSPLSQPQLYTPSNKTSSTIAQKKKRALSVAISDDEDDVYAKRARVEVVSCKVPWDTTTFALPGFVPISCVPMGRPLAPPPTLPRLAPGQVIVPFGTTMSFGQAPKSS